MVLPTGRPGRLTALGLAVLLLTVLWLGVAAPLAEWHGEQAERIARRATLAQRMTQVAATLPDWERLVAADTAQSGPPAWAVLAQPTDAVAGAALQQAVQELARQAGATLSSTEALPAEPAGGYRRIRLRVALQAPWPVLVGLLKLLDQTPSRGGEQAAPQGAAQRTAGEALPGTSQGTQSGAVPGASRGTPAMLVDDLQFRAAPRVSGPDDPPLDASFTVLAFRTEAPP